MNSEQLSSNGLIMKDIRYEIFEILQHVHKNREVDLFIAINYMYTLC